MNVTVETKPKSMAHLTIEVSTDEMKPYLEKAAEHLSTEHKIEGFRPGKASLGIVLQKLGAQAVWAEAAEFAVRKTYVEAIKEQKLQTVGAPNISVHKLAPDNPFIFHADVAVLPQVTLGDHTKIKAKKEPVVVTPEQIDKAVADLQDMFAKEEPIDRPAQKGDKVEVDFDLSINGQPVEGGSSKQHPILIGSGHFIPGFEDQLVGVKKGEHKEFTLTFPADYHNKELAGKPGTFKVDVKAVLAINKPALDDAFAKQASKSQTLPELRQQIEHNLKQEADEEKDREWEKNIVEELVKRSTFSDLPDMVVESEQQKMINELKEELERRGLQFDQYLKGLGKDEAQLKTDFRPQAEQRVKAALLLRAVAKAEQIAASSEEIDDEVQTALKTYDQYPEYRKQIESEDYRDFVQVMLTNRKVVAWLKSHAATN